uniref:Uncharacterized protein n=1 Tax=Anguilla anguilla TaxID=7936 RepID=A0A0E9S1W7_ANGAN
MFMAFVFAFLCETYREGACSSYVMEPFCVPMRECTFPLK